MPYTVSQIFACVLSTPMRVLFVKSFLCQTRRPTYKSVRMSATAGIIVIGDEILKGYTRDTNSAFLCERLFKLGIKVERINVIPDRLDVIASEVRHLSGQFTHVLTSGGVGTTHDDLTFEGVARAFGDSLVLNEDLARVVRLYFGDQAASAAFKLATVPSSAELLWGTDKKGRPAPYPLVRVRNVIIFPGIPRLLERAFDMIQDSVFPSSAIKFFAEKVYLKVDEIVISDSLRTIASRYDQVNIGSYPAIDHSYYKVKLTVDSSDKQLVDSALSEIQAAFSDEIVAFDEEPMVECVAKFDSVLSRLLVSTDDLDRDFCAHLQSAVAVIEHIFADYSLDQISVAYNGGKDCTALLHLVYVLAQRKYGSETRLKTLYIEPAHEHSFKELETFMKESYQRYNLNLLTLHGGYKQALTELQTTVDPAVKVIFMGSRSSDPNAQAASAAWTDDGWPRFLRACPLITWRYGTVWRFLRALYLPYCHLYDRGYTSMGSRQTTGPNDALKYVDALGRTLYKPAHLLHDEALERHGRLSSSHI